MSVGKMTRVVWAAVLVTAVFAVVGTTGWPLLGLAVAPVWFVPRRRGRGHGPGFWDFEKSELVAMLMAACVVWLFYVTLSCLPVEARDELVMGPRFLVGLWCFFLLIIAKVALGE